MSVVKAGERGSPGSVLPHGWPDVLRQLALFAAAYAGYEVVRGLISTGGPRPFSDATRIIDLERALHVFVEPQLQHWVIGHAHWLLVLCDWTYVYTHFAVTVGALVFIYLRRNGSFCFVRNVLLIAMVVALVGYSFYPTAPPRLMPQWGFVDAVRQFTGVSIEKGPSSAFLNAYAAVPSMHVCFALAIGWPMSQLVRHRVARALWLAYPALVVVAVVVTGNHYFTDVVLGALTALIAALVARRRLAPVPAEVWTFADQVPLTTLSDG